MVGLRAVATGLSAVAILAAATACSGASHHDTADPGGGAPVTGAAGARPSWLMTRQAFGEVTANASARRVLSATPVHELLRPGQQPLDGASARPVVVFASAAELVSAVRGSALPPHAYGVLYDPEVWPYTSVAEQRDPVAAAARAAAAAHAHGLRLIVAPALDLTKVLSPRAQGSRHAQFLALRLAGRMARVADIVELQSQSLERSPSAYRAFVSAAAAQARSANRRVNVLAGLSTNPPGATVTLSQLRSDIGATRSAVSGYWLNIPGQGSRCPTCNASRPDIAVGLTVRP